VLGRGPEAIDVLGDAVLREDLDRPRVDEVRLGHDRGPGVALDEQVPDAEVGQHDRGAQAAAAPADDQHIDVSDRLHSRAT
jgi:hypothetical protein